MLQRPPAAVHALILGGLLLAGCGSTALSTHIGITPNGLRVTPVLSTRVGGAQVSVSP